MKMKATVCICACWAVVSLGIEAGCFATAESDGGVRLEGLNDFVTAIIRQEVAVIVQGCNSCPAQML